LTRNDQSSDYPAWAFGMSRLAAAIMRDRTGYDALRPQTESAINDARTWAAKPALSAANQWKANSEAVLGELTNRLAEQQIAKP